MFCGSKITKKNGFFRGKQRYKCYVCKRQFSVRGQVSLDELWHSYSSGKQTYSQLAEQFGCSAKTIQRKSDKMLITKRKEFSGIAVVIMDKRLRSAYLSLKRNLPCLFVFQYHKEFKMPNTTNALYQSEINLS